MVADRGTALAALTPPPITDIAAYFAGAWQIERRIRDARTGRAGRFSGACVFSRVPGGLQYAEHGTLAFGSFEGPGEQSYVFATDGPRARVRFRDGRLFHDVDLAAGVALVAHDCPPDAYRGRYRVRGRDRWTLGWRIDGPRKRMLLVTRFRRAADDGILP